MATCLKQLSLCLILVLSLISSAILAGDEVSTNQSSYSEASLQSPYASWGVEIDNPTSIKVWDAWKTFKKKKDVIVAVVDTGIDPNHPFLKGNIYVNEGTLSASNFGKDFSKGRKSAATPDDSHGHGTHVAGIIKSIFPEVKILALKYYNPMASGQENLQSTIDALKYAVNAGVDIINYSGGGAEPSADELKILKEAEAKGILVIAAAGNDEQDLDKGQFHYYPASYRLANIVTVTTYDEKLEVLSSSNYGSSTVDLAAPGNRIRSSLPYNRAGYLTGTSQSTAFVSGVAALIKSQFPQFNYLSIKRIIIESAKKEQKLIGKISSGGRLDANLALQLAASYSKDEIKLASISRGLAQRNPNSVVKKPGKIIYLPKKARNHSAKKNVANK